MRKTEYKFGNSVLLFLYIPLIFNMNFIKTINNRSVILVLSIQSVTFLFCMFRKKINKNNESIKVIAIFFMLFMFALFSSIFSTYELASIKTTVLVFGTGLMYLFIILTDRYKEETFLSFNYINMYLGIILSIIAIALMLFGQIQFTSLGTFQVLNLKIIKVKQLIMGRGPLYRVSSLTNNPNTLGIILMISQISTIYLSKIEELDNNFVLFYTIQVVALLMTRSRGAILTSLIMIIVFKILDESKSLNKWIKISIYLISSILVIYLFMTRYLTLFSRTGLSDRDLSWTILINSIKENIFLGVGFGNSSKILLYDINIKAHNIYLNILSELGVIGFFLFLSLWIYPMYLSYKKVNKFKNNPKIKRKYIYIFTILFSLIFHQVIENKLLVYDYVMFLWLYLLMEATNYPRILFLKNYPT